MDFGTFSGESFKNSASGTNNGVGCGDRFISQRSCQIELNYETKSEIFSQTQSVNLLDKLGMYSQSEIIDDNQENSMNQANSCQGDEN